MPPYLLTLLMAAPLALVSAAAVRAMIAWPILDHPDARKSHTRPTPKGGGVGPVLAFIVGMLVLYHFTSLAETRFTAVVLAAVAIAGIALADDLKDFSFLVKLGAQAAAAAVAMATGLALRTLALPVLGEVELGILGLAITLFWIVGCTNAVNFMDGLDGLVTGVVVIASATLAVIAALNESWFAHAAAMFLLAGFAGFLPFNWHPARIFMGDVGSQFAGFMLAVLGVAAAGFEASQVSFLIVPLLLFGLLFDASFTLARRALAGERVSAPHRSHLYQMAQRTGVPVRAVAGAHWGFALFHAALAFVFLGLDPADKPLVVLPALAVQLVWAGYVIRRMRRLGEAW
ncbi:undecaprenyl/decaprenyl-phosphate alpha-N-acetylglucosaminyl 1-phosphate transferase [Roseococcus sp. SYP-B2431]|uniref:glycosyltransferase family 4 protein n=1 Tax=Roseococcus sp. SYP-B2431 TaxID=2496640 RepID=UPI00103DB6BD|nr:MraY family glycosyltransferase [Roseococcus sp. SYP-B2431]TCH96118.1 undecaprenyl/decaprenyl-phosphate alpha-N-acetylglucosaminyl 1-phosphate transferase [Roseococcus sp. SYP-B2431]